ncbi:MAG TPA: hypothetical protein VFG79_24370 [Solirubrobacter sp.]|nr:hypothetical protein [Solirubrobacter sp.]
MDAWTRRQLLAGAGALALTPALARATRAATVADGPVLGAPPLTDAQYFALADRIVTRLEHTWSESKGVYNAAGRHVHSVYNAALLYVHAVAAEHGHTGPARDDAKARSLVAALIASPPFFVGPRPPGVGKMFHSPGWVSDLDTFDSTWDKAIDPKVAEGLTAAWRARDALGLTPDTVAQLVGRVDSVARSHFFRFPKVRLNQFNWNSELYASAALMTGNPELLLTDYREQLRRFVAGVRRPIRGAHGTTNLGPSYRFHYLPHHREGDRANLDSAEYANITVHALVNYGPALAVGMRPLKAADMAVLTAWVERILCGYWMHSGMLNWDSGLGVTRWMKSKTWAYAQQGLLAIARAERFHADRRYGAWAKYLFDRGLALYEAMLTDGDTSLATLPSPHLYHVTVAHQGRADRRMFSGRMAANAMRAVTLGLGAMPAEAPPPLYAFDEDIGRLAVSTPRYATAIIAENRRAFPYGGVELARLFDGAGRPVGGLGGRHDAAFGIVIRGPGGRLATQTPRRHGRGAVTLVRSPRGRVARQRHLPRHPDAGPFRRLEAASRTTGRDAVVLTHHTFTERAIHTSWTIRRRHGRPPVRAEAIFPSFGAGAGVVAVGEDGVRRPLVPGGPALALDGIDRFELGGPAGRYTLRLAGIDGGSARAIPVRRQATNPRPGPSLAIRLPRPRAAAATELRAMLTL